MQDHLDRAVTWLLDRQHPDGWWTDELETNVTMTAEHVLLMRFLGNPLDSIAQAPLLYKPGTESSYIVSPAENFL